MGYLCNAESAITTCDSYNFDKSKLKLKNKNKNNNLKLRKFSYAELEAATNAFSPRTLLGKGSHGAVYRAVLDGGSLTAAVKKATSSVTVTAENEIEILSKIRSRRIVNLVGYATNGVDAPSPLGGIPKSLLLVVEYMPNGSLYDLIHKNPDPPVWLHRVRVALHVAKAVRALHGSNPPIIHRDIKSSNVLIDERENARLSDFGLALRGHVEDVRAMSTPPAGTLGYLDPCYLAPGDLSTKSDVFSFGILLLEIISGRRAIDINYSPPSIVDWALPLIKSGDYESISDRRIGSPSDPTVSRELAVLAARCVRSTAEKRPSMIEVVVCLKMIYKRVRAGPVLSNLRRRVRHVGRSRTLDRDFEGSDDVEEKVKAPRHGSRRSLTGRSRKVSNVPSSEGSIDRRIITKEVTRGGHRVGRSKSIGSFIEIKVGPDHDQACVNSEINGVKKRAQVTVKLSSVRLSKSRSMSVLSCGKISTPRVKEIDVFPLLVKSSSGSKVGSPQIVEELKELSIL